MLPNSYTFLKLGFRFRTFTVAARDIYLGVPSKGLGSMEYTPAKEGVPPPPENVYIFTLKHDFLHDFLALKPT